MTFPVNMTGYAEGLHLFRCLCRCCGGEYFLHPRSSFIADSGMCPVCDDLVRQVEACHSETRPAGMWTFTPVPPKQEEHTNTALLLVVALLSLLGALYGFWRY